MECTCHVRMCNIMLNDHDIHYQKSCTCTNCVYQALLLFNLLEEPGNEASLSSASKVFISTKNAFVASDKCIYLQCASYSEVNSRGYLSLLKNAFVCSEISCSEVSSRGYLIVSDNHIRVQCDIVFLSEASCLKICLEILPPPPKQKLGGKVFENLRLE